MEKCALRLQREDARVVGLEPEGDFLHVDGGLGGGFKERYHQKGTENEEQKRGNSLDFETYTQGGVCGGDGGMAPQQNETFLLKVPFRRGEDPCCNWDDGTCSSSAVEL